MFRVHEVGSSFRIEGCTASLGHLSRACSRPLQRPNALNPEVLHQHYIPLAMGANPVNKFSAFTRGQQSQRRAFQKGRVSMAKRCHGRRNRRKPGHCPGAEGLCASAGPTSLTRREEVGCSENCTTILQMSPRRIFLAGGKLAKANRLFRDAANCVRIARLQRNWIISPPPLRMTTSGTLNRPNGP